MEEELQVVVFDGVLHGEASKSDGEEVLPHLGKVRDNSSDSELVSGGQVLRSSLRAPSKPSTLNL